VKPGGYLEYVEFGVRGGFRYAFTVLTSGVDTLFPDSAFDSVGKLVDSVNTELFSHLALREQAMPTRLSHPHD